MHISRWFLGIARRTRFRATVLCSLCLFLGLVFGSQSGCGGDDQTATDAGGADGTVADRSSDTAAPTDGTVNGDSGRDATPPVDGGLDGSPPGDALVDSSSMEAAVDSTAPTDSEPPVDGAVDSAPPFDASVDSAPPPDAPVDSTPPPPDAGMDASVDAGCPTPPVGALFVDASAAVMGNGSQACPFKTITQALAAAGTVNPMTVYVAAGTYDAALGEVFPLNVGSNVVVEGAVGATCTRGASIVGAGQTATGVATIVLAGQVDCVTVTPPANFPLPPDVVFTTAGTSVSISNSSIAGGSTNVHVHGTDALAVTIQGSDISGAISDGVLVDSAVGAPGPVVSILATNVHNNGNDGIHVFSGNVTVGPGVLGSCPVTPSPSACNIYCNGTYGIELPAAVAQNVVAEGNAWNHAPPTSGPAAPADISSPTAVDDACYLPPAAGACP